MQLSSLQQKEIRDLVAAGQRILAVKRCREITGLGLNESMQLVNRIAAGGADASSGRMTISAEPAPKKVDATALKNAEQAAMAAIREGHIIEAVKRYRQQTGLGLKEAKDAVDLLHLVHSSGGRVNIKVAKSVMAALAAGRRDDALTQLMAGSGFDDAEARAFLATAKRLGIGKRGCGIGCVLFVIAMALVLGAVAAALLAVRP